MDLAVGARLLLRQWVILFLGIILTAGVAAYVYSQSPRSYQTNAQLLLLLPPGASGAELPNSPYLYLPNGLNILAAHVAIAPSTQLFRSSMTEAGFAANYTVGVEPGDPIVNISVVATDPDSVIDTRDALIARLSKELDRVQDEEKVPARQRAHFRTAGVDETAQAMGGGRLQAAGGAAAAGGLFTLLVAFLVDRRSRGPVDAPTS